MSFLKFSFFILFIALGGFSFYQFKKMDETDIQLNLLRVQLQESQKRQAALEKQVASAQGYLQSQKDQQIQKLGELKNQTTLEEQRLTGLKKSLDDLQQQKKNGNQVSLDASIKKDQDLLKDIENRIKAYQSSEKEINQNSNASMKLRKTQEKEQLEQVNANIKLQNQQIQQTRKDINFWQKKKRDPNQNDHLQELSTQLQNQENNLNAMVLQKQEINNQLSQNTNEIKYEANVERDEIKSTQSQLQSQALSVSAELDRLKDQKSRGQKDGQNLNGQISSLQNQINESNNKLKSLHDEMNLISTTGANH